MTLHAIRANFQAAPEGVRRDVFEGQEHLVVPVVMIVEGVLNDALVPAAEFAKFPDAWNGRPVPVLHPQENGAHISANRPDVIERNTIGQIFNARAEGGKLKADAWINTAKAGRLGYGDLIAQLESGQVVEVSTGYFSDDDMTPGEYNGKPYRMVHRNIRPDHLALLPGEIGACSAADGCGTRVNSKKGSLTMKVNEAMSTLAKALGMKSNCQCEGDGMDVLEQAKALVKANALDAKQLAAIQAMSPEDRKVMAAFIAALGETEGGEGEEMPEGMAETDPEEKVAPMVQSRKAQPAPKVNDADIDALVANKVAEHLRRHEVVGKLTANSANKLTDAQIKAMSVEQLEAVEQMIRPADYSGQGGFAANADVIDSNVQPLVPRGLVAMARAKKEG
ncbi:MAG: hypothetical protein Tp176DCM1853251_52 [Prokaryotic dsDNA virus sp.]|nr:MAG: hypothetical protein Tp176DCM1853251_52 [Prokaryotic dsDNA virus sp.]|tara:strand:+ start:1837 stop:3015 length:1179 start_codon:yes stop_codon:yes gene_type:complete